MYHISELQGRGREFLRSEVFPKISSGNTILFLGAGGSVTEDKTYLSKQLMEYHRAESGFSYLTDDITEYVDVLSRNPQFDRKHFDDIVDKCLRNLEPDDFHKTVARLPWKEIITTNLDTVIERAFHDIRGSSDENMELVLTRTPSEYRYNPANDEVKYVKLNGCMSDRSKYPFIFSTRDFESVNRFYKLVLQSVEHMSIRIQFLVIGYSFSDPFAKYLLERFDRYNYRNKREILLVDPTTQEEMLPYLESNNVRVIQDSAAEFFKGYADWEATHEENKQKRNQTKFRQKDNTPIRLPLRITNRLQGRIIQLHSHTYFPFVSPDRFYGGERPTYSVIKQNYDVVRSSSQNRIIRQLQEIANSEELVIPIVALTGSYGIGKTTFCYRLAHSLINSEFDVSVFEVLEPHNIKLADLRDLISEANTESVLLLFDECEIDSFFKAMLELRSNLSIQQLSGPNIIMLVPIRENILQKLTKNRSYSNLQELKIDTTFNNDEALELINKLDDTKVISVRDEIKRRELVSKVVNEYNGDPLVSLLSMVTSGRNHPILRSAYEELSKKAKESFMYTSLLYRFKIPMPSSLLMKLVSKDWNEFKRDVIEYDAKGILLQEEKNVRGNDPDLYFRTRHSVISDLLVNMYLRNPDKRFSEYQKLIRKITYTPFNSGLIVDLLKAIRITDEFTQAKVDELYDICAVEFSADPHFNLHYAINLQYRGTSDSLQRGIEQIVHVESYLESRNHRLTHRRAVLNHRLAELLYKEHINPSIVQPHIDEARELFQIKLIEDPFSIYSFREYLRFEIWYLETFAHDLETRMHNMVSIEALFSQAKKQLQDGVETIALLEAKYRSSYGSKDLNDSSYRDFINELYKDPFKRPYALILYYFYYDQKLDVNSLNATVNELKKHDHLDEVAKLLFRYYGSRLYDANNRINIFDLIRKNGNILREDLVRYHYYIGIAEAYDRRFSDFWQHMNTIRERYGTNVHMRDFWRDENGNPEVFDAVIVKHRKRLYARIVDFQYNIPLFLKSKNFSMKAVDSSSFKVRIQFYAGGMNAAIFQQSAQNEN